MARRRSVAVIKLVAGGEHDPIACFCGGIEYQRAWGWWPIRHVTTCKGCGLSTETGIKLDPPKPKPPRMWGWWG